MITRLDQLALEDEESGDLTIVVETPRGSRNKYKYDSSCHALRLGAQLAEGLAFPLDFGFFLSTQGADGDPLDVLLLLDAPVPPGCIATARLIGVIEVEQKEGSGPWKRNDRFLAVGSQSGSYANVAGLRDLRPHLLDEIDAFLVHYVTMAGKDLRITGHAGPRQARQRLKVGERAWQRSAQ